MRKHRKGNGETAPDEMAEDNRNDEAMQEKKGSVFTPEEKKEIREIVRDEMADVLKDLKVAVDESLGTKTLKASCAKS